MYLWRWPVKRSQQVKKALEFAVKYGSIEVEVDKIRDDAEALLKEIG